jgi:hypothetical protein
VELVEGPFSRIIDAREFDEMSEGQLGEEAVDPCGISPRKVRWGDGCEGFGRRLPNLQAARMRSESAASARGSRVGNANAACRQFRRLRAESPVVPDRVFARGAGCTTRASLSLDPNRSRCSIPRIGSVGDRRKSGRALASVGAAKPPRQCKPPGIFRHFWNCVASHVCPAGFLYYR